MRTHCIRPTAIVCLLAAFAVFFASPGGAAGNCVRFDGIDHCPVGAAELRLAADGSFLEVGGLGAEGADGVSSRFDPVTHWDAEMSIQGSSLGDVVILDSISNGLLTSTATLRLEPEGLVVSATFTGAAAEHTYTASFISNGFLVARFEGLDETSSLTLNPLDPWFPPLEPIPFPVPSPWPWPWPPGPIFDVRPLGNCVWGFSFGTDFIATTSSGEQAIGDTIRLVEDVAGPGHYPYAGFDAIVTRTNGSSLVITEENVSRP